jgi:hypothetical protein
MGVQVKDASLATVTLKSTTDGGAEVVHHNIDTLPSLPAGTNNIGDVDVLTLPALPAGANNIGDVDVLTLPALPAGTNAIGKVDVAATATIQRAAISAASSGNNTLVAAAGGVKTKVLGLLLVAAGAVSVKFQSGAGGTDLTGLMSLALGQALMLPITHLGYHHFETAANTLLNLSLSDAVQVSGYIVYYQEA